MRLVYDISFGNLLSYVLENSLIIHYLFGTCMDYNKLFIEADLKLNDIHLIVLEFYNWYISGWSAQEMVSWEVDESYDSLITLLFSAQVADILILYYEWQIGSWRYSNTCCGCWVDTFEYYSVGYLFMGWYLMIIIYKFISEIVLLTGGRSVVWGQFITSYIYIWINNSFWRVESSEDIICLIVLWPWCIFLIFTHLFCTSDYICMLGFAEWGLPVFYGLILLVEHMWLFGGHLVIYLMGVRGRRNLLATFVEDMIAFIIMISRVVLQSVRGIIVGMFHFICRESLLNMTRWWNHTFIFGVTEGDEISKMACWYDWLVLIIDIFAAAIGLILVIAIMFLQITFLVISVWLFCKCWFLSYSNINICADNLEVTEQIEDEKDSCEQDGAEGNKTSL